MSDRGQTWEQWITSIPIAMFVKPGEPVAKPVPDKPKFGKKEKR